MFTFMNIIRGTPYWVWGVLGYLLLVGIRALTPRTLHISRMAIMPLIFTGLSLYSFFGKSQFLTYNLVVWLAAVILGLCVGYFLLFYRSISFDKKTGFVHVPGSWIPLCSSLLFFCVKYLIQVSYIVYFDITLIPILAFINCTVSGLITGISWGRFLRVARIYQKTH